VWCKSFLFVCLVFPYLKFAHTSSCCGERASERAREREREMQQQSQLQEQGGPSGASLKLEVKWHGRFFLVEVPATATVWEVKLQLEAQTGVVPTAQKLIGLLPRGQQPPDDVSPFVLVAAGADDDGDDGDDGDGDGDGDDGDDDQTRPSCCVHANAPSLSLLRLASRADSAACSLASKPRAPPRWPPRKRSTEHAHWPKGRSGLVRARHSFFTHAGLLSSFDARLPYLLERARAREAALLEERLAREDAHRREEEEARLEQQRVVRPMDLCCVLRRVLPLTNRFTTVGCRGEGEDCWRKGGSRSSQGRKTRRAALR